MAARYTALPMDEARPVLAPAVEARVAAARARLARDSTGPYDPARHALAETVLFCVIHANNWTERPTWFDRLAARFSGPNMHCELWGGNNGAMGDLALSSKRGTPVALATGSAVNPINWPRKIAQWWNPTYDADHGTFLTPRTFNKMGMYNYAHLTMTPAEKDQIMVLAAERAGLPFATGAMYRAGMGWLAKNTTAVPIDRRSYFCSEFVHDVLRHTLDQAGRSVLYRLLPPGHELVTCNSGAVSPTALTNALLAENATARGVQHGINPNTGTAELHRAVSAYYGVAPVARAAATLDTTSSSVGPWARTH